MVLDEKTDLLGEVGAEEVGSRHRRRVHAGARHETVGQARVEPRIGTGGDPRERIGDAHARLEWFALGVSFEAIA